MLFFILILYFQNIDCLRVPLLEKDIHNKKSIKFSFLHLDCQTEGECYDQASISMYYFIFNDYYVRII